jgi:hypothetical protein
VVKKDEDDLLGVPDVARLFGLTLQRADELTWDDADFPAPVVREQRGCYWRRQDVLRYGNAVGRL